MEIRLLYIVTGSFEEAKSIGRELVDLKMAACVNILPKMISIYHWKNKVTEDEETILLVKTQKTRVQEIMKLVKSRHSYECPCLLSFAVETGLDAYLGWVKSETESHPL